MNTRQHLVETWKSKLDANSQPPVDGGERFAWVRQIYTRIYQFLVSCYGEGDWRGTDDASSVNVDFQATRSRMPFVECVPPNEGLLPKSPERIRAALESIHGSNPGIATAGTTVGVQDDTWIIVAARKKSRFARAVRRRLVADGIEVRLFDRATDTAIAVRYEEFQKALAVIQGVERAVQTKISARYNPRIFIGVFLLVSSTITVLVAVLSTDMMRQGMPVAIIALWIAGLTAGWHYIRGRQLR